MTERKCEWLESGEYVRLFELAVVLSSVEADENLKEFIRAHVEEEIRKEREACAHRGAEAIRARGGEK